MSDYGPHSLSRQEPTSSGGTASALAGVRHRYHTPGNVRGSHQPVGGRLKHVLLSLVAAEVVSLSACTSRPIMEQASPTIPGTKFKTIATIAGGDAPPDLRMSVTVRQQLNEAGWTAVRRSGRWESEREATDEICAVGDVDGVLFVEYNRLRLDDCASRLPAFRIQGSPDRGVGLTEMMRRLITYLRRGAPATAPGTPAPVPPPPPPPPPPI